MVDRWVARLLRHEFTPDDFEVEDGACRLRDGRRGTFYRAWERQLDGAIGWRGESTTWRRLIHLQAGELARWLDGNIRLPRFWHLDDQGRGRDTL